MYLLKKENNRTVILIGLGLVGLSISNEFIRNGYKIDGSKKVNWNGASEFVAQDIFTFLEEAINDDVCIIWSAGKCGFSSDDRETKIEELFFSEIMSSIEVFLDSKRKTISFYLISSIGGLFEGQVSIEDNMIPYPRRAYGRLKMSQEKILLESGPKIKPFIFRLSSIYGSINSSNRMGLIQVLISNGIKNKITRIYGSSDTLRDYTSVDDVSKFICSIVRTSYDNLRNIYHLANGKASSIDEIKSLVEKKTRKRLLLSYENNTTNDLNIVCNFDSYGGIWNPSSMNENIRKLYEQTINN